MVRWCVLLATSAALLSVACNGSTAPELDSAEDSLHDPLQARLAGPPSEAVVTWGREHVGSPFRPPDPHDRSFRAIDAIRPRTTVISAGGTVTFRVAPAHKPAIYEPGVRPDDVDVTAVVDAGLPFPFPPLINDTEGRIVGGSETTLNTNFGTGEVIEFQWTFEEPGRYLVICEVLPHFVGAKMYAWVDVK